MLPVNRYLAINIGVCLITKNRIAVRRASPFIISLDKTSRYCGQFKARV